MIHDTEVPENEYDAPSKFGASILHSARSNKEDKEHNEMVQGLSDPLFASKLDKMDTTVYGKGKNTFSNMAYHNDYVAKQKNKTSVYDY